VVQGASDSKLCYRRKAINVTAETALSRPGRVESRAPSTTLLRRVVPLPRYRGAG
jgi:hypothetical protein